MKYEHYRVRVPIAIDEDGVERVLRDEWFRDPEPHYKGLELHRTFGASVTVRNPKTGALAYREFHEDGELLGTEFNDPKFRNNKLPSPEHE